ncbi:hypothetical protein, partial [Escherichia coli]|uniref:hypothetical protein n=1 Tax=Escherichia coli TaxID=562 RepID=UPI001BDD46B7
DNQEYPCKNARASINLQVFRQSFPATLLHYPPLHQKQGEEKGHTHTTQDVIIGYTRIKICNPVDICPPPVKEENNP